MPELIKAVIMFLMLLLGFPGSRAVVPISNDFAHHVFSSTTSTTILVPENYSSIQEAIDAAAPGDTIYVNNATYYENISINKSISLIGKAPSTTIINGSKSNETFNPAVSLWGEDAGNSVISNFTITGSNNAWGIYIIGCSNITVRNNIISSNHGGLIADASNNNTIIDNVVLDNVYEGIFFFYSFGNSMRNNTIAGNLYNFGISESDVNNNIDESNSVEGKPIRYLKDQAGITVNPITYPEIGYLALINCSDVVVENLNLTNNYNGILIAQTSEAHLRNNTFANNVEGVNIWNSTGNKLENNSITGNWQGITIADSANNTLRQNNFSSNQQGFEIAGNQLEHFLQDIDTTNTVDAKLVYYLTNQTDLNITSSTYPNAGYLALANCRNITIQGLSLENNSLLVAFSQNSSVMENSIMTGGIDLQHSSSISVSANCLSKSDTAITVSHSDNSIVVANNVTQNRRHGILLESSSGCFILGNRVANGTIGIRLDASANNSIVGNHITGNKDYGINLWNSGNNRIYHNNLIDNGVPRWQAVCSCSQGTCDNSWDNGYPSGGNYWSDYNGTDKFSGVNQNILGSDAVGDTSYNIMTGFMQRDRYPLAGMYYDFLVVELQDYYFEIVSNSSVTNFTSVFWLSSPNQYLQPGQRFILFNVDGEDNTTGSCRVTIPRILINGSYVVLVDWHEIPSVELAESNSTHAFVYFSYNQSEHEVIIVPEYGSTTLITMMIAVSSVFALLARKRSRFRKTSLRGI